MSTGLFSIASNGLLFLIRFYRYPCLHGLSRRREFLALVSAVVMFLLIIFSLLFIAIVRLCRYLRATNLFPIYYPAKKGAKKAVIARCREIVQHDTDKRYSGSTGNPGR